MDYKKLADILFPDINETIGYYENEVFPKRNLPAGAKVTRLAPSPTGFIHLGNLYGAFVDERLAHQSEGVFMLRIEDTDEKRKVEGSVEIIISSLKYFGLNFDEGALLDGETGSYGPYYQSNRGKIYQCVAKYLVEQGRAYPCFCTEEELEEIRKQQVEENVNTGYYGKWAKDRNLTLEEIQSHLDNNEEFVIRFKSMGNEEGTFEIEDAIRGKLAIHENYQDIVILKTNGIPTYHFAHVVDDHLMRVTHVVRGEEWLSTLPIHYEIFTTLGWDTPVYCHTAHLMKMDNGAKRKLSKRKDPELGLGFYMDLGYHPAAVREYLLTILNSNYEEWRMKNAEKSYLEFSFSLEKMSNSGALFDMNKMKDVSKEILSHMTAEEIYNRLLEWTEQWNKEYSFILNANKDRAIGALNIGRNIHKVRKDLVNWKQTCQFMSMYFDETYRIEDEFPASVSVEDRKIFLSRYMEQIDFCEDKETWFSKVKNITEQMGYASNIKDYKKHPESYNGSIVDLTNILRIAVTGRSNAPDIWEISNILGKRSILERIRNCVH